MELIVPKRLVATCQDTPEGTAWLQRLPDALHDLQRRWCLTLGEPFDGNEASCSWVAPVTCRDGTDAVLKLGMPHMEARHELHGLRYWDGEPTAQLLQADEQLNAMLLEQCKPGTPLRALSEPEQDVVIAGLLRRLWRVPPTPHPFRPLSMMTAHWSEEALADQTNWTDAGLVAEGLHFFEELPRTASTEVLLATDLHAGNVLRAQRQPWLVIDPKPFIGDPAYDATQHLLNCEERLRSDPDRTICSFADLLEVDEERLRLWLFARCAVGPTDDWEESATLARALLNPVWRRHFQSIGNL